MLELVNLQERERSLQDSLEEFECITKKLSKLAVRKDELVKEIIAAFAHDHDGQKTYEFDRWRVEVKTPSIYSLDKKKYESGNFDLPVQYNPIKETISYNLDKKRCDQYISEAPKNVRDALIELIEIKPGKPGVVLKGLI